MVLATAIHTVQKEIVEIEIIGDRYLGTYMAKPTEKEATNIVSINVFVLGNIASMFCYILFICKFFECSAKIFAGEKTAQN